MANEKTLPSAHRVRQKSYARNDYLPDKTVLLEHIQANLDRTRGDVVVACSVCPNTAAYLVPTEKAIWINSALRRFPVVFDTEPDAQAFTAAVAAGHYRLAHTVLCGAMADGLDYYCPDCDRMYCADHYDVQPKWDGAFYDCSTATCPRGHQRDMDD